ncbi:hypothetical protein Zmor_008365 [Zophobas morio]|uniref:Fibrinogen C-terminal domain-containing protein n=1 Tax=Zophobas morio TaxID=2755281 RepID=A0AA38MMX6_9CUCU|nr:hypothetical protein Zmor_008365 [Zophobas morio]
MYLRLSLFLILFVLGAEVSARHSRHVTRSRYRTSWRGVKTRTTTTPPPPLLRSFFGNRTLADYHPIKKIKEIITTVGNMLPRYTQNPTNVSSRMFDEHDFQAGTPKMEVLSRKRVDGSNDLSKALHYDVKFLFDAPPGSEKNNSQMFRMADSFLDYDPNDLLKSLTRSLGRKNGRNDRNNGKSDKDKKSKKPDRLGQGKSTKSQDFGRNRRVGNKNAFSADSAFKRSLRNRKRNKKTSPEESEESSEEVGKSKRRHYDSEENEDESESFEEDDEDDWTSREDTKKFANLYAKDPNMAPSKQCNSSDTDSVQEYPKNCQEVLKLGHKKSGIYMIHPILSYKPFFVKCNQKNMKGGWTYVLNRQDGSQDFNLLWTDYETGFGNLAGEFWLGLKNLYYLTGHQINEMLMIFTDFEDRTRYSIFKLFSIGDVDEGYAVRLLGKYEGTATDGFLCSGGAKFSTLDVDQDNSGDHCALQHSGGWWFNDCCNVILTGIYNNYTEDQISTWLQQYGSPNNLMRVKMLVRPAA